MDKETADKLRGMIRRGTIKNIKDDGEMQTASVEIADGIWRDNVEVHQPYGTTGVAPQDGALALIVSVGGDEADPLIVAIANPSKRMGKLNPGDQVIYNAHGDKIVVGADGTITIAGGAKVQATVGGAVWTITAGSIKAEAGGCSMTLSGSGLAIEGGQVTHNGNNIGDSHKHPESIGSVTGAPF